MVKRLVATAALLSCACPTLSVVGTQCVNGSCDVAGFAPSGLVCVNGFCVVPGDGGPTPMDAGADAGVDAGCLGTPEGCVVDGGASSTFVFEGAGPLTNLVVGRFGARAGFVYAADDGSLYAVEGQIDRTLRARRIATNGGKNVRLTTFPSSTTERFSTLEPQGALRTFLPLDDGGFARWSPDMAGAWTFVAGGFQPGTGGVLAGVENNAFHVFQPDGGQSPIGSANWTNGCLTNGRLLATSPGGHAELVDLPMGGMGNRLDAGVAWTKCATFGELAFTAREAGGIDRYRFNTALETCVLAFADGGVPSAATALAAGFYQGQVVVLAGQADGLMQLALPQDGGCEVTQVPRPDLAIAGGYRAIGLVNADGTANDDLILLDQNGAVHVDWR